MKLLELLVIDNKEGIGATSYNMDVDYRGIRVEMKPSIFFNLAHNFTPVRKKVEWLKLQIENGVGIASPFLIFDLPEVWLKNDFSDIANVVGHEGRHRTFAIQELFGDQPIEVHLLFRNGIRHRNLNDSIISQLQKTVINQDGHQLRGPFFNLKSN